MDEVTRVESIMSRRVVTVELDDTLEVVKDILESTKFHHVIAVEEGRLYGVVSDRDLLRALSPYIGSNVETPRDVATLNKRVHQIMTRKPISLPKTGGIDAAIRLLLDHHISCLPIVDDDLKPIGIVTWRDILKWVAAVRQRQQPVP